MSKKNIIIEQEQEQEQEQASANAKQELLTVDTVKHSIATKEILSAYLNDKGEYTASATDKDGNELSVTIKGENAYNSSALSVISDLESMSDKMKAFHISEINEKQIILNGYKTKAEYVAKQCHKLSVSQVSKLNRVGRIFLTHSVKNSDGSPVYEFRAGIPVLSTITNLQECLSLLTDDNGEKLDFSNCDKLKENECDAIVKRFVTLYIDTEILHPQAPCKAFREELRSLRSDCATKGKGAGKDEQEQVDEQEQALTEKQICLTALATLASHIIQDEQALEQIANLVDFVNAHMTDEQEQEQADEQEQAGE